MIGSSGGGAATLGHTNASDFVKLISNHLKWYQMTTTVTLDIVLYVSVDDGSPLDSATGKEDATLLYIQDYLTKEETFHDSLDGINNLVRKLETTLAEKINNGDIDGLISVSCEPSLVHRTLQAASIKKLPVTGSGGTSLSEISSSRYKLQLIGNSGGSVATTPETKAVSFASAFSQYWDLTYSPWKINKKRKYPAWRSVFNACLPAFWSVTLLKRLVSTKQIAQLIPQSEGLVILLETYALPTVCSVIMASSRRHTESSTMAAIIAASACKNTILGGLLAGFITSWFEEQLLYICILKVDSASYDDKPFNLRWGWDCYGITSVSTISIFEFGN